MNQYEQGRIYERARIYAKAELIAISEAEIIEQGFKDLQRYSQNDYLEAGAMGN